jgi:hypothetical protein
MTATRDRGHLIKESGVKKGELVSAEKLAAVMRVSHNDHAPSASPGPFTT